MKHRDGPGLACLQGAPIPPNHTQNESFAIMRLTKIRRQAYRRTGGVRGSRGADTAWKASKEILAGSTVLAAFIHNLMFTPGLALYRPNQARYFANPRGLSCSL